MPKISIKKQHVYVIITTIRGGGSALMTTEMVMEEFPELKLRLVDVPVLEGTIAASVTAAAGLPLEAVVEAALDTAQTSKLMD